MAKQQPSSRGHTVANDRRPGVGAALRIDEAASRRRGKVWRSLARLRGDESGSVLVEMAMSLPLLVMTVILAMAVLLIIQARFGVQAAAREAGMVGSQVNTTIDAYNRQTESASTVAERVMLDYGLDLLAATVTFDGTPEDLKRGSLFQVQIEYVVQLPTPSITFWNRTFGNAETTFTVQSRSVVPIQKHKARWPCPSPDPICS